MSDAPRKIWVSPYRNDWQRDPKDKGSCSYIGDACDGPENEDTHAYIHEDHVFALLAAAVREGLEIAAKTTEWEPAYAIADVCGQFIREKATDENAIAEAVNRIKETPDR